MIEDVFEQMTSFDSLYYAHKTARRGKRGKKGVMEFELNLGINLMKLQEELRRGEYKLNGYKKFFVYEPKKREIQTLPYRDRIVQHALCDNILTPYFEKRFIYDNVACQEGKGTHFAVKRLTKHLSDFYRKYGNEGYFLKADIRKYFQSIDHEVLVRMLDREIMDKDVKRLLLMYINSYENDERPGKGLAQGNQVSQVLALYYLNPMDRFVKEKLRIKQYIRYMDDLVLIHYDKDYLAYIQFQLQAFIEHKLRLEFNEKTEIQPLSNGIDFIGFHFYMTDTGKIIRRLRKSSKERMKRNFKKMKWEYQHGYADIDSINKRIASIQGHLRQGHTYHLQRKIFSEFTLERLDYEKEAVQLKEQKLQSKVKEKMEKPRVPRKTKNKKRLTVGSIDELSNALQLDVRHDEIMRKSTKYQKKQISSTQ